ncbi:MAG: NAD(P)H-hydrate dehydratase [bacterium]|nr:NAD(P)H-hydrate dehydratase [bacterium]
MKGIVSAAQAKQQDASYEGDLGAVMEAAGYAVAGRVAALGAGYGTRVLILAGTGNNGGDGYVAARHLARRGAAVTVLALGEPRTPEAIAARTAWQRAGGAVRSIGDPEPADFIVDAVFGVGFRGELPPHLPPWREAAAPIVAIDVPSGLDATTGTIAAGTMRATSTVALSNYKLGHFLGSGPEVVGKVELVDLGMPAAEPTLLLCEEADAPRPDRPGDSHKWSAGSVAVVGGSAGMAGAAMLAAKSALRFGAGAVATFVPGALAAELDAAHPEVMTHGVGTGSSLADVDVAELLDAIARFDSVVVGPGMGPGVEGLVAALLERITKPAIVDADGLNAATVEQLAARTGDTVVTPHGGEFVRLAGEPGDHTTAASLAARTGSTVLLKGPATIVASHGATPWLVSSGGPELATVGTGDVLAGMIGALCARGLDVSTAARSGAFWHGQAGAVLASTSSVTADSLVDAIRRFAF